MSEAATISITVNGKALSVRPGTSVAAVLMSAGAWRKSVSGEVRGPVCGMGICFECRATVDGLPQVKTCQVAVRTGMVVETE